MLIRFNQNYSNYIVVGAFSIALTACGGSESPERDEVSTLPPVPPIAESFDVLGTAIKGPLAHATVRIYEFNTQAINFKGNLISEGLTNETANIIDLAVESPLAERYIIEFEANENTIDLTTGKAPVLNVLTTLAEKSHLENGNIRVATPISHLALEIASHGDLTFTENLSRAYNIIASTLGLNFDTSVDWQSTIPTLNATVSSTEQQTEVIRFRAANDAIASISYQLALNSETNANAILTALAADLADGVIDGTTVDRTELPFSIDTLNTMLVTPVTLPIANDDLQRTLADIKAILVHEIEQLGIEGSDTASIEDLTVKLAKFTLSADIDQDGLLNIADNDDDGDGVNDTEDSFPLDSTESLDTDGDGTGNNADNDDDGDGINDTEDSFPLDSTESLDTDGDGTGNNADNDDDGDGVNDTDDSFPLDSTESLDTDGDGIGNNADSDDDDDGVNDTDDSFPLDNTESLDTDGDGTGNNTDSDDDGDGVNDEDDAFPLDSTESLDTDGDGTGNNADNDDDGDGVNDEDDASPLDGNETLDTDGDGIGNNADSDDDGDGVNDEDDAFPLDSTESLDTDGDGIGNNTDSDDDGDGVNDVDDAFPLDSKESLDTDGDGTGNNTDSDDDGDGVNDEDDAFPLDSTESLDTDGDGTGNNTDTDDDGDGVNDEDDAFPLDSTETLDTDGDGVGNNTDIDDDGDGILDENDANPLIPDSDGGSGGGSGGGGTPPATLTIDGSGVKGPMAFANVTIFALDYAAADFKGQVVATASTNASAQIQGLTLPDPASPPYLLEISGTAGTYDITTNAYPVIDNVSTVITQVLINGGEAIYATPLTTMAVSLAISNADSNTLPFTGNNDSLTTEPEFLAALPIAAEQVKSTLGFGLDESIDIFDTPPLINNDTETSEEQANTATYRSAVEAVTAVVYQMQQLAGDTESSTSDVLNDLTADLSDGAIDGAIDGVETDSYPEAALEVLEQDPAMLPIPGTAMTVSEVKDLVVNETATTGSTTDTTNFASDASEIVLKPAETNPDIDGDGVPNAEDAFPEDASRDTDSDQDGLADVLYLLNGSNQRTGVATIGDFDTDDDNDGVLDTIDDFPLDPTEFLDTDGDGVGNNADNDDDDDLVLDVNDAFPLNSAASSFDDPDGDGWPVGQDDNDADNTSPNIIFSDLDGDGLANSGGLNPDLDDDNDGVEDTDDSFPLDASESRDLDLDGIGDNSDPDIDGDNVSNNNDLFPYNPDEYLDTDLDGIGNNTDTDDDGDTIPDDTELAQGTDPLNPDSDGDGVFDATDALPLNPAERFDSDKDGIGNNTDNCPVNFNSSQVDTDTDGFGDACDRDDDGDSILDVDDKFPLNPTEHLDSDLDGIGNNADDDDDNDGVLDTEDAFSTDPTEQLDTDNDGIGNNADDDDDGDGVLDSDDAFPLDPASSSFDDTDGDGWPVGQDTDDTNSAIPGVPFEDFDGDGFANEGGLNPDLDDDNDGVLDVDDLFDNDPTEWADLDGDGTGDNSDLDIDGDSYLNADDDFPFNNGEWLDTDGDGVGNNTDEDDDNDGVIDSDDAFDLDASEWLDSDGDGTGDNTDVDVDGDGHNNDIDEFPYDATEWLDSDGDGLGNNGDNCPLIAGSQADMDNDQIGDLCDTDIDGDGVANVDDYSPANEQYYFLRTPSFIGEPAYSNDRFVVQFGSNNSGYAINANHTEKMPFDYLVDGNVYQLAMLPHKAREVWVSSVSELVDLGIATPQQADNYITNYGDLDNWYLVKDKLFSATWTKSAGPNANQDTFTIVENTEYLIDDATLSNRLTGSHSWVEVTKASKELNLNKLEDTNSIALSTSDFNDQTWGMTAVPLELLSADILNFNSDGSGTTLVGNLSFNWSINNHNEAVLNFPDNGQGVSASVSVRKYETFTEGVEWLAITSINGEKVAAQYSMGIQDSGSDDIAPLIGKFLDTEVNHHVDYQDNGEHILDVWGWTLNHNGVVDNFSFKGYQALDSQPGAFATSTNQRLWQQDPITGEVMLTQNLNHVSDSNLCVPQQGVCSIYRKRHWYPLYVSNDRFFVVEWELQNDSAWDQLAPGYENYWLRIAPRINFYQVRDLTSGTITDPVLALAIRNELGLSLTENLTPHLASITELDLSTYPVSDLSGIASLTNLVTLDLSDTDISDLSELLSLSNLTSLTISNIPLADESQLAALTGNGIAITGNAAFGIAEQYYSIIGSNISTPEHYSLDNYYHFNPDGTGQLIPNSNAGSVDMLWKMDARTITIDSNDTVNVGWYNDVNQLVNDNIISQQIADQYIASVGQYLPYWVEVSRVTLNETLVLDRKSVV